MNFEKFKNLDAEKRKVILQSARDEFNKEGFNSASTNNIVKEAKISKGALFSYFGNKENLYLYLYNKIMDDFMVKILAFVEENKGYNVFEKIKNINIWKLNLFLDEPENFQFIFDAITKLPDDIAKKVEAKMNEVKIIGMKSIFDGDIDKSIKKDIDTDKAIFIIFSTLENLSNKYMATYKGDYMALLENRDNFINEINDYLNLLKKILGRSDYE